MVRRPLLPVLAGGAAIAVALHFGYWWWVTGSMKHELAAYAEQVLAEDVKMDYTARATGYPFHNRLALDTLKMSTLAPMANGLGAMVEFGPGLMLETVSPLVRGHITMTGTNVPVTMELSDSKANSRKVYKGMVGSVDSDAAFTAVAGSMPNGVIRNLALADGDGRSFSVGEMMTQADFSEPLVRKFTMRAADIRSGDRKGNLKINGMVVEGNMALPEATGGALKAYNVHVTTGRVEMQSVDKTGPHTKTISGTEVLVKMDVRGEFADLQMMFGLRGMAMPAKSTPDADAPSSMPQVINSLQCSLVYTNMRADLLAPGRSVSATAPQDMSKLMVEGMIKDKTRLGLRDCLVDTDTFKMMLNASLGATEDGYPDVLLDLKGNGPAMADLNMLKDMMMPSSSGPAPSPTEFVLAVRTVSGTLNLNGEDMMPLPKLSDLVEMGAAARQGAMPMPGLPATPLPAVETSVSIPQ